MPAVTHEAMRSVTGTELLMWATRNAVDGAAPVSPQAALNRVFRASATVIEEVDLRGVPSACTGTSFLRELFTNCDNLTKLTLSAPVEVATFAVLPSLASLCFSGCTEATESMFAGAAIALPRLVHFAATGSPSLSALGDIALCATITDLDVSWSGVTTENLALAAGQLPELRRLTLAGCAGVVALVADVPLLALTELDVRQSGFTQAGVDALPDAAPSLRKLYLRQCDLVEDVTVLRRLPNLEFLDISWFGGAANRSLAGIERFPVLKTLAAAQCGITSAGALRLAASVEHLDLSGNDFDEHGLLGIEEMPRLTSLDVSFCSSLEGVRGLAAAPVLRSLTLVSCPLITRSSLDGLPRTVSLRRLLLSNCAGVDDVTNLANVEGLEELSVCYTDVGDDGIAGLERLPRLRTLSLVGCKKITDVNRFRTSTSLTQLLVSSTGVTPDGISALSECAQLDTLDLSNAPLVTTLGPAASAPKLRVLHLENTPVDNAAIAALAACSPPMLSAIYLGGCAKVTDLTPLAPLVEAGSLVAVYCAMSGVSVDDAAAQLGSAAKPHPCQAVREQSALH